LSLFISYEDDRGITGQKEHQFTRDADNNSDLLEVVVNERQFQAIV